MHVSAVVDNGDGLLRRLDGQWVCDHCLKIHRLIASRRPRHLQEGFAASGVLTVVVAGHSVHVRAFVVSGRLSASKYIFTFTAWLPRRNLFRS